MNWKAGDQSTYTVQRRDTASADFDIGLAPIKDTIVRTILSTNQTFMGRSNVAIYRDSSTHSRTSTLGHMSQDDNGDLWIYNFGEAASAPFWQSVSQPVADIGWVEYGSLGGVEQSWTASGYIVPGSEIGGHENEMTDDAELKDDDTVTVQGKTYTAKHILHTLSTNTSPTVDFYTIYIDSYVVPSLGQVVKEIVHSYKTPSWPSGIEVEGTTTLER